MNVAIILAGGTGTRLGAEIPKQFLDVAGRPMLAYTLQAFDRHPLVDAIEVVCHPGWMDFLRDMVAREGFTKVRWVCEGGATFQESENNGIENLADELCDDDIVLTHYGDSPMVSEAVITDAIRVCEAHGNASPASSQVYLAAAREDGVSTTTWLDRDQVMRVNAPQALRYGYARWLREEGERRGLLGRVDPHMVSLMLAMGERMWFSLDETTNIKVTNPEDLLLLEGWVLARRDRGDDI